MPRQDPSRPDSLREVFPGFYDNPAIRSLARSARWTVSGRLGDPGDDSKGKAPIDIVELVETGRLRGAFATDETCLMPLEDLIRALPLAANHAFFLRARTDGLLMVDIEPDCPPGIAADLIALPEIVYSEVSMSGRGFHLLAPLPTNFWDYPVAAAKTVLREEHGWYEFLLEHWVTFTRQPIPVSEASRTIRIDGTDSASVGPEGADPEGVELEGAEPDSVGSAATQQGAATRQPTFVSLAGVYDELAQKAIATLASARDLEVSVMQGAAEAPDIPGAQLIVGTATAHLRLKDPKDFDEDTSRWEFSVLAALYRRLVPEIEKTAQARGLAYSDSDHAWLLYLAATKVLPPRAKHTERRNQRPFLLDRAAALIAERRAAAAQHQAQQDQDAESRDELRAEGEPIARADPTDEAS